MKSSPIIWQIWIPFAFSVILCGLAILPNFYAANALQTPSVAFFCFLPLAFLFVSHAIHQQFTALERRIKDLEAKASPQAQK